MQLVLQQTFPLGRFHATPWKVFPYDDPHGEWPPSPWRLVRAVLARSYQLDREIAESMKDHAKLRDALVRAFATSQVKWQLPPSSWRGPGLRQYHPAEFKRVPAGSSEPGMMAYSTTKVLDNFWVTAHGTAAPVIWHFDGPEWTKPLLDHLDACLARVTYFGRAESITEIRRSDAAQSLGELVRLSTHRSGKAVPVLSLQTDATLAQLEATTDSPAVANTNIPPGARWMYAERPPRPRNNTTKRPRRELPPANLIQFAIGSKVPPQYKDTVLITERFRGRVLQCYSRSLTQCAATDSSKTPDEIKERIHLLAGKSSNGEPAIGHRHVSFLLCGNTDQPSRLCVWRSEPFDDAEQRAILGAAATPLPLNYKDDPWTLTLVPLDQLVPPPPGLGQTAHRQWRSLSLYVPPRHVYGRGGRIKPGSSVEDQLGHELTRRGFRTDRLTISAERSGWVKIHRVKQREGGPSNNDKLGYTVSLIFDEPVYGPISLGGSNHFGLGLFVPAE